MNLTQMMVLSLASLGWGLFSWRFFVARARKKYWDEHPREMMEAWIARDPEVFRSDPLATPPYIVDEMYRNKLSRSDGPMPPGRPGYTRMSR